MRYLVFSHRKMQWHCVGFQGYTSYVANAGHFTQVEACTQVLNALPGANTAVDEALAMQHQGKTPAEIEDLIDNTWRRL